MIDINLIKNNPEKIQKAAKAKGIDVDIKRILEIDEKHKNLLISVQKLREERNNLTDSIKGKPTQVQIKKGKELKEKLEKEDNELKEIAEKLKNELLKIPNPAKFLCVIDEGQYRCEPHCGRNACIA